MKVIFIHRVLSVLLVVILQTTFVAEAQNLSGAPRLVELDSDEGVRMLDESASKRDFFLLVRYFNTQQNMAYCGVASSVMILNALPIPKPQGGAFASFPFYTQENFFSTKASAVKSAEKVASEGMTLAELTDLLNTHPGVKAEKTYASATTLDAFRAAAYESLNLEASYVAVNYLRKALGQNSGGHISPLAAYHKQKDAFLILDVSQYKYPPVWVSTADLWKAMEEKDAEAGKTRGFVVVSTH
ncbi:MAG: phytochelatin synthase family protein [Luteolibacter sp.]